MTLAQLLLYSVLLSKAIGIAMRRISENVASLIKYAYFIALLQFAPLVATDYGVVHVCAIARQILQNSDRITTFILREQQAVSVRYGGRLQLAICTASETGPKYKWQRALTAFGVSSNEVTTRSYAVVCLFLFIVLLLLLVLSCWDLFNT